jgi:ribonuclease Y
LEERERQIKELRRRVEEREEELKSLCQQQRKKLEELTGVTTEEAKRRLLLDVEEEVRHDAGKLIRKIEQDAKEEGTKRAKQIIAEAMQRCAAEHVKDTTISVVTLPNDEMKGRIIGREGRNIRTLESLTGVDLIIDDTPEAVILSGFDALRREIASLALEQLVQDGRIHPTSIEEAVVKAQKKIDEVIKEEGEKTLYQLGVHGVPSELVYLLGKLKYRTSYGQNVLAHSKEVARLAGIMAAELGADVTMTKRAGLFHDIGKATDQEQEGSHAQIGAEILKSYGESEVLINAVVAHHGECEAKYLEAAIVQAADAVSAARPGARREDFDAYLKRLKRLESIATSFAGVQKAYAIQAGREIRIMVQNEAVDDEEAVHLARQVAKRIEDELEYPGQIKVVVIREKRVVEYAR